MNQKKHAFDFLAEPEKMMLLLENGPLAPGESPRCRIPPLGHALYELHRALYGVRDVEPAGAWLAGSSISNLLGGKKTTCWEHLARLWGAVTPGTPGSCGKNLFELMLMMPVDWAVRDSRANPRDMDPVRTPEVRVSIDELTLRGRASCVPTLEQQVKVLADVFVAPRPLPGFEHLGRRFKITPRKKRRKGFDHTAGFSRLLTVWSDDRRPMVMLKAVGWGCKCDDHKSRHVVDDCEAYYEGRCDDRTHFSTPDEWRTCPACASRAASVPQVEVHVHGEAASRGLLVPLVQTFFMPLVLEDTVRAKRVDVASDVARPLQSLMAVPDGPERWHRYVEHGVASTCYHGDRGSAFSGKLYDKTQEAWEQGRAIEPSLRGQAWSRLERSFFVEGEGGEPATVFTETVAPQLHKLRLVDVDELLEHVPQRALIDALTASALIPAGSRVPEGAETVGGSDYWKDVEKAYERSLGGSPAKKKHRHPPVLRSALHDVLNALLERQRLDELAAVRAQLPRLQAELDGAVAPCPANRRAAVLTAAVVPHWLGRASWLPH